MKKSTTILILIILTATMSFAQLNRFKEGAWYSIVASHSGKALEIKGGIAGKENELQLQQNDSTGADNQLFQFKKIQSGYYQIIVKHSGKVLEVKNGSVADHDTIQQNVANGKDCQLFTVVKATNGTNAIVAKHSGYGFDVLGGLNARGNNIAIIQYPVSGAPNQFFRITEIKKKD